MDNFKTLIESDWNSVRKFQSLLADWEIQAKGVLPQDCCGVLFYSQRALATNGHWAISCECKGNYYGGDFLFYNYLADDIELNRNPFEDAGVDICKVKSLFFKWQPYLIKIRIQDILDTIYLKYKTLKEQRRATISFSIVSGLLKILLRNKGKNSNEWETSLVPWKTNITGDIAPFSLNCGYLTKILKILVDFGYFVADLCFGGSDNIIIIKGIGRRRGKVPIKIALAQYYLE